MRPDRLTFAAFAASVVIGGLNFVAVRFSNEELAPFWGAGVRFAGASLILVALAFALRVPWPQGRALVGALVYGVLNFGVSYALAYWALLELSAGMGAVIISLVPLLTLLLAVAHGIERFRWRGLAGATIAALGVALIFQEQVSLAVPPLSIIVMLGATLAIAETNVVLKWFPRTHPIATNAVGMPVGTALLLALSVAAGEPRAAPVLVFTWLAVGYLVVASAALFILYLTVITRWTASATSYGFVLQPLVTLPAAAALRSEAITPVFAIGAALVLAGVYVGALAGALGTTAAMRREAPAR